MRRGTRIRQAARQRKKEEKFTTLFPHLTIDLLEDAFGQLDKDAAHGRRWPDMEGVRGEPRAQSRRPARPHSIEEPTGRCRAGACISRSRTAGSVRSRSPLSKTRLVLGLDPRIVQRATAALLNAIYEEDFRGFSYGFRPGRGAHDALDALRVGISSRTVNFILDADIRSFFDEVNQDWLIRFVEDRVGDRRIIRLIRKWLKAGVLDDGIVTTSDRGTGQGSTISPRLANIDLHYVFDLWADPRIKSGGWRRREAAGDMIIVRYADDIVVGFEHEDDARGFLDAMRERLREFALTVHPDKTRPRIAVRGSAALLRTGALSAGSARLRQAQPETFTFLGFVCICSKSRRGSFLIKRKSQRDRMQAKLQAVKQEVRRRMHQPIPVQGKWLGQVVRGWFNYHGPCRPTVARSARFGSSSPTSGGERSRGAAKRTA